VPDHEFPMETSKSTNEAEGYRPPSLILFRSCATASHLLFSSKNDDLTENVRN
jgi:hypothetical protein